VVQRAASATTPASFAPSTSSAHVAREEALEALAAHLEEARVPVKRSGG